jgi:hypothetical protein
MRLRAGRALKDQPHNEYDWLRENLINNIDLRDFPLITFVVIFIASCAAGKYTPTITWL